MIATEQQTYYFGNGRIAFYKRNPDGTTAEGVFAGDAPDFKITLSTEKKENFESMSGRNLKNREVITQIGAEFAITLKNLSDANLALLVWGVVLDIDPASSVDFTIPTPKVGYLYRIPDGFNITELALEDSTVVTPVDLVEGTHYSFEPDYGAIKILSLTGLTGTIKGTFDRDGATVVPFFTGARPHRFGSFHGINKGNEEVKKCLVELYDMVFDPVADLSLIGDDFGNYELKGSCLLDETREADETLGGFGRKLYLS